MLKHALHLTTLALLVLAVPLRAQDLIVGKPAPELALGQWVKGEPVTELARDHVWVVEFWATWCPPCVKSIPHLTELQTKHRDRATIIGVSVDQDEAAVAPFVERKGDDMNYRVAIDRRGAMSQSWMRAAGLSGIPSAFIVARDGRVAWIGNPLDPSFDAVLAQVVEGTYDIAGAVAKAEKAAESARRQATLMRKAEPIRRRIIESWNAEDYDGAFRAVDELVALDAEVFAGVAVWRLEQLLVSLERPVDASAYAKRLFEREFAELPDALHQTALVLVNTPGVERDLDLARAISARAVELTEGKAWELLDTLAFIEAAREDWKAAAEQQARALAALPPEAEPQRQRLVEDLEYYEGMAGG